MQRLTGTLDIIYNTAALVLTVRANVDWSERQGFFICIMPWIAGALSFFPAAVRHRIVIGGRRGRPSESADCAAPPSSGRVRCAGSPLAVSVRRTSRSREKKEKKTDYRVTPQQNTCSRSYLGLLLYFYSSHKK